MLELDLDKFTPTRQRIIDILLDGKSHPRGELIKCLEDPLASWQNLAQHISVIRKAIQPRGCDIVCVNGGYMRVARYRLVRQFLP